MRFETKSHSFFIDLKGRFLGRRPIKSVNNSFSSMEPRRKAQFLQEAAGIMGLDEFEQERILLFDIRDQLLDPVLRLPSYDNSNPAGAYQDRPLVHYGSASNYGANLPLPMNPAEFRTNFVLGPDVFPTVFQSLQIPDPFPYRAPPQYRTLAAEDAFLIWLKRISGRETYRQLKTFFGKSEGYLSGAAKMMNEWLYQRWTSHKVSQMDTGVFDEARIFDYGAALRRRDCPFGDKVAGFTDGTLDACCRPYHAGYNGIVQRGFFSGNHHDHGLQYEVTSHPDGLISRCFGPLPGATPDLPMARANGLQAMIRAHYYGKYIYADKAFLTMTPEVLFPILNAQPASPASALNYLMSVQRVHIEHDIGRLYMHCRRLQTEMRIGDEIPGLVFLNAVFLTNVKSCVYRGNETAQWYDCVPPTLAEYLA